MPKTLTDGLNKGLVGMGGEKLFKMIDIDWSDNLKKVRI